MININKERGRIEFVFNMYSQFSFPLTVASVWLHGSHMTMLVDNMLLFWRKDTHTCT